ncbi:MAG: flagellar basal body-associated FliL family protein [Gammaproteobacteria bacterium]|nr:flagellar basal body-associated FliL family protein [Gammaproteobacteria bacterium]
MKQITLLALLFIGILVTPLASGAAKEKPKEESKGDKKEQIAPEEESTLPKIYLKLDPSLVVNVEEKDVTRFLQVDTQLQFTDPLAQGIIEKHMPAIRHTIIMVISGSDVPTIKTSKGKEELRKNTLVALQKTMGDITGEPVIEEVYFTGFIIQ